MSVEGMSDTQPVKCQLNDEVTSLLVVMMRMPMMMIINMNTAMHCCQGNVNIGGCASMIKAMFI